MAVDEEQGDDGCYYPYKQPGFIPFQWEIRPGVPKHNPPPRPASTKRVAVFSSSLKPPPPVSFYYPIQEPRTRSFLSSPRTRSFISSSPRAHSHRFADPDPPLSSPRTRPEVVAPGCFPSPTKRVGRSSRRHSNRKVESEFGFDFGPDYGSDLETMSRWSVSHRKSSSPFLYYSPDSSSWSKNSPVGHTEWAALNLF